MGKTSLTAVRGRWSALERRREQNDDTAISIIDLACACLITIDLYGVCEETDKRPLTVGKASVAVVGHGAWTPDRRANPHARRGVTALRFKCTICHFEAGSVLTVPPTKKKDGTLQGEPPSSEAGQQAPPPARC